MSHPTWPSSRLMRKKFVAIQSLAVMYVECFMSKFVAIHSLAVMYVECLMSKLLNKFIHVECLISKLLNKIHSF